MSKKFRKGRRSGFKNRKIQTYKNSRCPFLSPAKFGSGVAVTVVAVAAVVAAVAVAAVAAVVWEYSATSSALALQLAPQVQLSEKINSRQQHAKATITTPSLSVFSSLLSFSPSYFTYHQALF